MQYDPAKANEPLLAEIAIVCEQRGINKWTFGEQALNDRRLVLDLEKGRELRGRTMARLRNFMASHPATGDAA